MSLARFVCPFNVIVSDIGVLNATRRMLHDVIILVYVFNFSHKDHKQSLTNIFSHIFPSEGNFDIDAGDGDGGGAFRTLQISQHLKKTTRKHYFPYFPPEGNFDIDAGDGGNPNNPNISTTTK